MSITVKFILISSMILVSLLLGYAARRLRVLEEKAAEGIMTFVSVFGYPTVSVLTIWAIRLHPADMWLPTIAVTHVAVLAVLGGGVAKLLRRQRDEIGLFAIVSSVGNNGFTMGAFVVYLIYGEAGLGLANIFFVLFTPAVILMMYPVARHYAGERPDGTLAGLLLRSIFDWRSLGLPMAAAGIALSLYGVPRPAFIADWHVIDAMVYALTPLAYFAIGLRLHASGVKTMKTMILALAFLRFPVAAGVGLLLAMLTWITPWPIRFGTLAMNVVLIESFVPTAVTAVAVANMFRLRPRDASLLFVANTVMYLALVLPVILWIFGRRV